MTVQVSGNMPLLMIKFLGHLFLFQAQLRVQVTSFWRYFTVLKALPSILWMQSSKGIVIIYSAHNSHLSYSLNQDKSNSIYKGEGGRPKLQVCLIQTLFAFFFFMYEKGNVKERNLSNIFYATSEVHFSVDVDVHTNSSQMISPDWAAALAAHLLPWNPLVRAAAKP